MALLAEFCAEDSEEVLMGSSCNHKFHKTCAMLWLTNTRKPKDLCPYCRKEMMSSIEMKTAAVDVLGEERVNELSQFPLQRSNTTMTWSQDTQDSNNLNSVEVPDVEQGIGSR